MNVILVDWMIIMDSETSSEGLFDTDVELEIEQLLLNHKKVLSLYEMPVYYHNKLGALTHIVKCYIRENDSDQIHQLLTDHPEFLDRMSPILKKVCKNNKIDILKMLLENFVDITTYNEFFIISCAKYNNIAMLQLLMDYGLNIHIGGEANYEKYTGYWCHEYFEKDVIMFHACWKGSYEMVEFLLKLGFDPNIQTGHLLLCSSFYPNIVKLLIDNGADFSLGNNQLLYVAISSGNFELTKILMEAGCDPNSINADIDEFNTDRSEFVDYLQTNGFDMIRVMKLWCSSNR